MASGTSPPHRDMRAEERALRDEAGLYRRGDWTVVRVSGADGAEHLQRMLTQDVSAVPEGCAAATCLLTPKGRLVAAPVLWNLGTEFLLDLDARSAPAATALLERSVITEDVTFDATGTWERFALVGRGAPAALTSHGLETVDEGVHREVGLEGGTARVLRHDFGSRPGYEWIVPADEADAFEAAWTERDGVSPVGAAAWDAARVAEGVPAWGTELEPEVMPLEARLDTSAISWTKGCYPGQEVVSMAHHRGHPARLLVRLALDSDAAEPRRRLRHESRVVGHLTTVCRAAALGYVRYELARARQALSLEGGGRALVLGGR